MVHQKCGISSVLDPVEDAVVEPRAKGLGWRLPLLAGLLALLCLPTSASGQPQTVRSELMGRMEMLLRQAQAQEADVLAPSNYTQAMRLCNMAEETYAKGGAAEALRIQVEQATAALKQTMQAQAKAREVLGAAVKLRAEFLEGGLDKAATNEFAAAERGFSEAVRLVEAGQAEGARQSAGKASADIRLATVAALRAGSLNRAEKQLEDLKGQVAPATYAQAAGELKQAAASLTVTNVTDVAGYRSQLEERLKAIVSKFYPPIFLKPPKTLRIGTFTLYVDSYEGLRWDFAHNQIIHASGVAWTSTHCHPFIPFPFPLIGGVLTNRQFSIVSQVVDPLREIRLADAQEFQADAQLGGKIQLELPKSAISAKLISESIAQIIGAIHLHQGDIKVHFDDLTIQLTPDPDTGLVAAGTATYPTVPAVPTRIEMAVAGFVLYIDGLVLSPNSAVARAELEFPNSIVDPGTGHPGRVKLTDLVVDSMCQFHAQLPSSSFGPWAVGNTGMLITGTGMTVDFSTSWAAPGAPPGASAAVWRGVILNAGRTVTAMNAIVSNSGYLKASYKFANGLVTAPGLATTFSMTAPFQFGALQPFGYDIALTDGHLEMDKSAIVSGTFLNGTIALAERAAMDAGGTRSRAQFTSLTLDANLDLTGEAKVTREIVWGDLVKPPLLKAYSASGFIWGRFYLSGTYKTPFLPVDPTGAFEDPVLPLVNYAAEGMQGVTLFNPKRLIVHTLDTPTKSAIPFTATGNTDDRKSAQWLNVGSDGVSASLPNWITATNQSPKLGPTYEPFYVGKAPFETLPVSHLETKFVTSAVYESDMQGMVNLAEPTGAQLPFQKMVFTSTANNAGGRLVITSPITLDYWGLGLVQKPGSTSAGVMSVKTGQILLTAAGLRETRHFGAPFYLNWGEMLADGSLGRLFFDYNSVGQKFDRFNYVPSAIRLSAYDPAQDAYLQVAGMAYFDLFGGDYLNVHDIKNPSQTGDPFDGRKIQLGTDTDAATGIAATDTSIAANWSGDFGTMSFTIGYDDAVQDGFIGTGKMGFLCINDLMHASIVLKAEQICMTISETDRHDFTMGQVAHFGTMSRISGCACVQNGQLQRAVLSAELESSVNANVAMRSATYGRVDFLLTPTLTRVSVAGDMYLNVIVGGDMEISGKATFTVNRALDYVEGEVDGKFDTSSLLGTSSVSGDGQLNWHIGTLGGDNYQSIQGRIAVTVLTPVVGGSAEGGFYVGLNAPKTDAWVLEAGGSRYKLNMAPLPDRLTGVYGYVKVSSSVNLYIFSGGIEIYAGMGAFVLTPSTEATLLAVSTGLPGGLPFAVGNVGVHIWGDILGGLVSAGGWGDFNIVGPYPFSFQGTIGLEGCVLWVFCGSVDVTCGVNSSQGFFLN